MKLETLILNANTAKINQGNALNKIKKALNYKTQRKFLRFNFSEGDMFKPFRMIEALISL